MKTKMSEKVTPGKNIRKIQFKRKVSFTNSCMGGKRRKCEILERKTIPVCDVKKRKYLTACENNLVDEVRLLLDSGADVNWRREEDGQTGLHMAALSNYQELLELLLAQTGVNVNLSDQNYRTPLMTACQAGQDRIVRRLCQFPEISLNCVDDNGLTALHFAIKFSPGSSAACVSQLRDVGGPRLNWNVKTDDGRYPVTMAVFSGNADILQIILSVGEPDLDLSVISPSNRNVAQLAVESYGEDSLRCVELLSRADRVNWNIKNRYGETPLMYCLKNNKSEMARIILEMEKRFENKHLDRS